MIKIENTEVMGWEHAIRGMRNPLNSWDKMDSHECDCGEHDVLRAVGGTAWEVRCPMYKAGHEPAQLCNDGTRPAFCIGENDHALMMRLAKAGPEHAKYRRMIVVYADVTAPLYWWKEYDTYKVGTVANSCSTMHKITLKPFVKEDFSYEHLCKVRDELMIDFNEFIGIENKEHNSPYRALNDIVEELNQWRDFYIYYKNKPMKDIKKYNENLKAIWWQMIQLLPSSYNQRRTLMLNYEVLANIYKQRKNHKLDEWTEFCKWIEDLPYSVLITGKRCEV